MLYTPTKPTIDLELNEVERDLTAAYERLVTLLRERHPSLAADFGAASGGLFAGLSFVNDILADTSHAT